MLVKGFSIDVSCNPTVVRPVPIRNSFANAVGPRCGKGNFDRCQPQSGRTSRRAQPPLDSGQDFISVNPLGFTGSLGYNFAIDDDAPTNDDGGNERGVHRCVGFLCTGDQFYICIYIEVTQCYATVHDYDLSFIADRDQLLIAVQFTECENAQ